MKLIRLTDADINTDLWIDPSLIKAVGRFRGQTTIIGSFGVIEGRDRIFVVKESVQVVADLVNIHR